MMSEKNNSGILPEEWDTPTGKLVIINLIFYAITSLVGGGIVVTGGRAVVLFGFSYSNFAAGGLWLPLTSIFAHGSIAHLGFNMIYLLIFGFRLEERDYDPNIVYGIYIFTGIASSMTSMIFFSPASISLGASGAVFGLLGANAGIERREKDPNWKKIVYVSIILFIFASGPNTNVFAHLMGLIFGYLLGQSTYLEKYENVNLRESLK